MRRPAATRLRAWFLRTFRGRSSQDAAATWQDALVSAGPVESYDVAGLSVEVIPQGIKASGVNQPSMVYRVTITERSGSRTWTSSYGFEPGGASARQAAEAALGELYLVYREPERWREEWTEGMSEDEAEAMLDGTVARADLKAAQWVGPRLAELRERRPSERPGWLEGVGPNP